jgi:hypothetical protein
MSNKKIKIRCQGAGEINLDALSKENYNKLKNEIVNNGFSSPFYVWENPEDAKMYILDGHQRFHTLKQMRDKEGFVLPQFPIVMIDADNKEQAAHKLLSFASQYGKIEDEGLYEFLSQNNIFIDEVSESFSFPEINMDNFAAAFFNNETAEEESEQNNTPQEQSESSALPPEAIIKSVNLVYDGTVSSEFYEKTQALLGEMDIDNLSELVIVLIREKHKSLFPGFK